jgi:uncharacterized protein YndB with AHSA1/START domain
MSTNRQTIAASPEQVFAVLADANTYEHWVVGCDDIRAVEGDWPAVGSRFFHTVGIGPVKTKDNTLVLEVDAPHKLVLEARARPAGIAKVIFRLVPVDGGTDVSIEEYPIRGVAKVTHNPVQDGLIKLRNVETLRRLEKQVLQRNGAEHPSSD